MTESSDDNDLDDAKEIRVTIPVRQHLKLRALKLFTDQTMSQVIEEALDGYLDDRLEENDIPMPEGADQADRPDGS